ncbi:hypothetical protein RintRC_0017 [Richelia intracellularis]|nr:hypothetical protein RintRC_0017 [Richelia intracellularis]
MSQSKDSAICSTVAPKFNIKGTASNLPSNLPSCLLSCLPSCFASW